MKIFKTLKPQKKTIKPENCPQIAVTTYQNVCID